MSDDVFCSQCGHRNMAAANFCTACGSRLGLGSGADDLTLTLHPLSPEGEPGDRDVVVRVNADGPAVLILERGSDAGLTFELGTVVTTAGRNPECEIFLDDITVSRKHAAIRHIPQGYEIRDEGSLNGTYVNGERISSVILHSGDEVLLGKFRLLFVDANDARRTEP